MVVRFFRPPNKSFFLFGARGTGKSTWVKAYYPSACVIDLLQPDEYRTYTSYPERLREYVYAREEQEVFVIDEVQKVPALLSVVHSLIEKKRGWLFVLTGSSARKLKREGVDLLAGRAQLKKLGPFLASEVKEGFNLKRALRWGMLPLIFDSSDPEGDLKTYIALYMKEEVQMEGLVRNIEQFAQFLEVISFSQASTLNCTNIGRDCHVSGKTVENYVTILEDLLLAFRLPVFTKKAKRNLIAQSKFYYFDVGVYRSLRPAGPLDHIQTIGGHALETLVAQHLRGWLEYSSGRNQLSFWRTKSGLEVDFIVYGDVGFYAIEVKSVTSIAPKDLRSLKEFQKDYPEVQCILLYGGRERLMKGAILCVPVEEFLLELVPGKAPLGKDVPLNPGEG